MSQSAQIEADLRARATRQAVLAELGLKALGRVDLQTLLDEAVARIGETLDVDTCTVLELLPDGKALIVRAAVGWDEPLAGKYVVDAGKGSQAGYTLLASEPVIVPDTGTETRFLLSPVLARHGIRSGMTVIIHGRDRPYGVFGVQSRRLRDFAKEDVDYFQTAANVLASAIDHQRSEDELRRSEQSFRTLIEHAPEGVLISQLIGEERILRYVNRAMASWLGYASADELLGRSAFDVVHPDDRPIVAGRLRGMDATGVPATPREIRFLRRDGTIVLAESIGVPIVWAGQPAIAALTRDVTERRKMEARLQLGDRLTSLGNLAAGVAHEINNPLMYVLGNLEVMRGELASLRGVAVSAAARVDDLAGLVDQAKDGGERIRQIVSDLKTFSRHDNEDQLAPVDLLQVLDSSINITHNEIRHRAQLVRDYRDVPRVTASPSRLGQVFLNLLVNAAQAIPDGAMHQHRIDVRTLTDSVGRAVVEVADTGAGIPSEILDRLFDPFFTTKPLGVGTGLGLSICHSIVHGYGGDIAVESEIGKGSCFRVTLPAAQPAPASVDPRRDAAQPAPSGRVLVVDDEPFVGSVCRRMLVPPHDVVVTTSASDALSRIEEGEDFDVILCDLMMPEMSGMDFFDALQQRSPPLADRVVFLSGGAFSLRARVFRETVANLFLDKPCSADLLRSTVAARVQALRAAPRSNGGRA